MQNNRPIVSVIMAVYNTEQAYLEEAIDSILQQTLTDFEFIIVDDCSTDGSVQVIREYAEKDSRIRPIYNQENLGLTKSLNVALRCANGKYIARMDADDVSLKHRFERQVSYMEQNEDVAVLGSYVFIDSEQGLINRGFNEDIEIDKIQMLFHNAGVAHPTAMIRKQFLDAHQIQYDEEIRKSQDYALWLDCVYAGGKISLLKEILFKYRIHDGQISQKKSDQDRYAKMVMKKALRYFGGNYTENEVELHCTIAEGVPNQKAKIYAGYFSKLFDQNRKTGMYNQRIFKQQLNCMWLRLTARRLKYHKKFDFLFCFRTINCLTPGTIKAYYYTYIKNEKDYELVKRCFIEDNIYAGKN